MKKFKKIEEKNQKNSDDDFVRQIAFMSLSNFQWVAPLVWKILNVPWISLVLALNLVENYVDSLLSLTLMLVCDIHCMT